MKAEIAVKTLVEYWNPLADDIWGCGVIRADDVIFCQDISKGKTPADDDYCSNKDWSYNVARIAYFTDFGWSDCDEDLEPITVVVCSKDVTPFVYVKDGNHRLAAAMINGRETIQVVLTGDLEKAAEIFKR